MNEFILQMATNKKWKQPSLDNWLHFMQSVWLEAISAEECEKPKDDANFVLCGGNSMSAVKMLNEVQDHFGCNLPRLLDILLNHTWKDLCEYVQQELHTVSPKKTVVIYRRSMATGMSASAPVPAQSTLQLAWKFDTKKCVDASPLAVDR